MKEGMSEDNIEAIRRFDLEQFNRDRAYESRLSSVGGGLRLLPYPGLSDPRLYAKLREREAVSWGSPLTIGVQPIWA